jgi:hypothetical protein
MLGERRGMIDARPFRAPHHRVRASRFPLPTQASWLDR